MLHHRSLCSVARCHQQTANNRLKMKLLPPHGARGFVCASVCLSVCEGLSEYPVEFEAFAQSSALYSSLAGRQEEVKEMSCEKFQLTEMDAD